MLILNRKANEGIVLRLADGRQIRVLIARISAGSVKVGLTADSDVTILREELLEKRRPQECEATFQSRTQEETAS
jgi:carbon storage regulator CsrA